MKTVELVILVGAGLTAVIALGLVLRIWPLYRKASGPVRNLLASVGALALLKGVNGLFWAWVIVTPVAERQAGSPLYPLIIVGFLVLLVGPPLLMVWVWRNLRG